MSMDEIMQVIEELAQCQGFYGRMLCEIGDLTDEEFAGLSEYWEAQDFQTPLDFVLFIEG